MLSCRLEGQRRWRSEVNRRYQQSREARRDHADRQRSTDGAGLSNP